MASPGSGDELLRGIAARLMARQSAGSFGKPSESGPKAEPKPKPVPVNPTGHLRTIQRENIAPMANTGPSTFGTAEQLAEARRFSQSATKGGSRSKSRPRQRLLADRGNIMRSNQRIQSLSRGAITKSNPSSIITGIKEKMMASVPRDHKPVSALGSGPKFAVPNMGAITAKNATPPHLRYGSANGLYPAGAGNAIDSTENLHSFGPSAAAKSLGNAGSYQSSFGAVQAVDVNGKDAEILVRDKGDALALEARVATLEKQLSEFEKQNSELKKQNSELGKQNSDLGKQNLEQKNQIFELGKQNSEVKKQSYEQENQIFELEKKNTKLKNNDDRRRYFGTRNVEKTPFELSVVCNHIEHKVQVTAAMTVTKLIRKARETFNVKPSDSPHPRILFKGSAVGHGMTLRELDIKATSIVQLTYDGLVDEEL